MAQFSGCPGSRMVDFREKSDHNKEEAKGKTSPSCGSGQFNSI